jgi:hypothetical protein
MDYLKLMIEDLLSLFKGERVEKSIQDTTYYFDGSKVKFTFTERPWDSRPEYYELVSTLTLNFNIQGMFETEECKQFLKHNEFTTESPNILGEALAEQCTKWFHENNESIIEDMRSSIKTKQCENLINRRSALLSQVNEVDNTISKLQCECKE